MFCRSCGKPLSDEERAISGNVYCTACAPAQASAGPSATFGAAGGPSSAFTGTTFTNTLSGQPIPGLAFFLGLIPGVGAIYNAQYVKGLVHAVLFGTLAAATDSGGPSETVFGFLVVAFLFYMAFEAYHTAQKRLLGEPVDEFSSLLPRQASGVPVAPLVLIVLGVGFLASNLGLLRFDWLVRFWPIGLIALGIYLLYERLRGPLDSTLNGPMNTASPMTMPATKQVESVPPDSGR
jgi:hypothetical protein